MLYIKLPDIQHFVHFAENVLDILSTICILPLKFEFTHLDALSFLTVNFIGSKTPRKEECLIE